VSVVEVVAQPFLHESVSCLAAPTAVLSGRDGQIRPGGADGVLRATARLLSELVVTLDGVEPAPVGHALGDAAHATFTAVVRHLGDAGADPTVRLVRERTATSTGLTEHLLLVNNSHQTVNTRLSMVVAADLAGIPDIKSGRQVPPIPPEVTDGGMAWRSGGVASTLTTRPVPETQDDGVLGWDVVIDPGQRWSPTVEVVGAGGDGPFRGAGRAVWSVPGVRSADRGLGRIVQRGLSDLVGLTLASEGDVFLGAGSPWFFTLFGRDSLWAARMLLPLGTGLAAGTLRTLARYQGTRFDERTGEAPGKIIHEVRDAHGGVGLPPEYYGTIDATALWVCTLHDAWRWGLPAADAAGLLGPLRAALDWLTGPADPDGDGFLEYVDSAGTGLANQGWKDSGDAIQWPDGRIAEPPIALCEAQAYAHEAAVHGADLLDALSAGGLSDDPADADRAAALRGWAAALRDRFRAAFWTADAHGPLPALALDGAKRPVPVAASNLGHLLGTGLLDAAEAATVADRLTRPDLDSGSGLRTLTSTAAGANPLGYHTGSIWPHDTAIAVLGLIREGHPAAAASLAGGLLAAAPAFDHRLPELFAGTDARAGEPVLAYPAACRPQAWSAASAVTLLQAALGLSADVPAGMLTVHPDPAFASWYPLRVTGLVVAGHPLEVTVDPAGAARASTDAPLTVDTA
jgi:hypothetical protein